MKLSVHLVSWNGSRYVPYLFESLRKQTYRDWSLVIVDNNSTDGMADQMAEELKNFPVPARLIRNTENKGFAPGHNQAYRETNTEYFLLLNQDMNLAPNCLEKMVAFLDSNPNAAAVSPRLMRWKFSEIGAVGFEKSLSTSIDALGLKIFRNRRVIEQSTGEDWEKIKGEYTSPKLPVFGVSGAFPMYRRSAIKQVAFSDGTILDETYFMYKEDVDLAYRLAAAGFASYILLDTFAHHDRTGAGPRELSDIAAAKNKKSHNKLVRYYSYKNHLATLYKNEYCMNLTLDFPWIFWYEVKKFCYFVLFDRGVLKGLGDLWKNRKTLKARKKEIKTMRRVLWKELRKWWQ